MNFKKLTIAALMVMTANMTFAQDTDAFSHTVQIGIPEVALLDIEASSAINLQGTAPTEAGEAATFDATDNASWINYSSIVGTSKPARHVDVQITDGTVPAGLLLKVTAGAPSAGGDGTKGAANANSIILSEISASSIISGIGSSYTGNGVAKGHNLTYALSLDPAAGSYANLNFDESATLTISYTLVDN